MRTAAVLGTLAAAALTVILVALALGPITVPLATLVHGFTGTAGDDATWRVVTDIRAPRVLVAFVAGAGLALSGAVMQTLFANPLAEPGMTGVSAGAALAAVIVIATGIGADNRITLPAFAFGGALLAVVVVQAVAHALPGFAPATLLLVGVALNALFGALVAAIIANAPHTETLRSATFWLNGDLVGRSMTDLALVAPPVLAAGAVMLTQGRSLDLLVLGDDVAETSGVATARTRRLLLFVTALATAATVAVTGVIAFVGLVAPHLVRLILGAGHRVLLPASALVGGTLLVCADTVARLVFHPVTLQTGTIMAFFGAPALLALVLRRRVHR